MIEVIKDSRVPDFCHKTEYSAGYDLYACLDEPITIRPGQIVLVPTGIRLNMMRSKNSMALVLPRSGVSLKTNLRITNSPGLIDQDYTGEIKIIIQNIDPHSDAIIQPLDRIAQLVLCNHNNDWVHFVDTLGDSTERGSNGFGSTGSK